LKIENQKDLAKLIKLCRDTGVSSINVDGIDLVLGPAPMKAKRQVRLKAASNPVDATTGIELPDMIETDELTPEQLLNWSSAPGGMMNGEVAG
jgi:hypothetical protein